MPKAPVPVVIPEENPSRGMRPHPKQLFIPKTGWEEVGMRDGGIPGIEGAEKHRAEEV